MQDRRRAEARHQEFEFLFIRDLGPACSEQHTPRPGRDRGVGAPAAADSGQIITLLRAEREFARKGDRLRDRKSGNARKQHRQRQTREARSRHDRAPPFARARPAGAHRLGEQPIPFGVRFKTSKRPMRVPRRPHHIGMSGWHSVLRQGSTAWPVVYFCSGGRCVNWFTFRLAKGSAAVEFRCLGA